MEGEEFNLFYTWQSDRPANVCRNFIQEALNAAKISLPQLRIDSDPTESMSGSPDAPSAVFNKISVSDALVADITPVARTERTGDRDHKACGNPNVFTELGYALHAIGSERIILVANQAWGPVEYDYADIRHFKKQFYKLGPESSEDEIKKEQIAFGKRMAEEVRKVVGKGKCTKVDLNDQYSKWWVAQKQRAGRTTVRFEGLKFEVDPGVFSPDPRLTNSSSMMARYLIPRVAAKSVLDLGTGCGVLAILAAKHGAKKVLAVDNLSQAVTNARENVAEFGLPPNTVKVVEGDLFKASRGKFDVILANLPIDPRTWKEYTRDVNELARRFLRQVRSHLTDKGVAVLTWASLGNLGRLKKDLEELRIPHRLVTEEETFGVTWYLFEIFKAPLSRGSRKSG